MMRRGCGGETGRDGRLMGSSWEAAAAVSYLSVGLLALPVKMMLLLS